MFIAHKDMNTMLSLAVVEYCNVCGVPEEFCRYGSTWDLHTPNERTVSVPAIITPKVAEDVFKSKSINAVVTVKIAPRIGRRYLSTISGLHAAQVDLGMACKIFAKKFACGVGRKDESDEVEIQGDVEEHIVQTITHNFKNIKAKNIVIKRK